MMNSCGIYSGFQHSKALKVCSFMLASLLWWLVAVEPLMAMQELPELSYDKTMLDSVKHEVDLDYDLQVRTEELLQEALESFPGQRTQSQRFSSGRYSAVSGQGAKTYQPFSSEQSLVPLPPDPLETLPEIVRRSLGSEKSYEVDSSALVAQISDESQIVSDAVPSSNVSSFTDDKEHSEPRVGGKEGIYPLLAQSAVEYMLLVNKTGSGTVTGEGIECGSACMKTFAEGTPVVLSASPNTGWSFTGWSGACSGTGDCTLLMNAHRNVRATFEFTGVENTYTVTASAGNHGGITPSGTQYISCGTSREFSMTPDDGYQIADILVDGTPIGAMSSYTFTSACDAEQCDPNQITNVSICDNSEVCTNYACTNGICLSFTCLPGGGGCVESSFDCMEGGAYIHGAMISCASGNCTYKNADGSEGVFGCGCIEGLGETHTIQALFVKMPEEVITPYPNELRSNFRMLGVQQTTMPCIGDPVNSVTGNHVQQFIDFNAPGLNGLELVLERTYNSRDPRHGLFGYGWSSLLDMSLRIANDGSIDVRYPDGAGVFFVETAQGYIAGQNGVFDTLRRREGGYVLETPDHISYSFDETGSLLAIGNRYQQTITFHRDAEGTVNRITDTAGRVFRIAGDGRHITSISDPLGRIISYGYNERDELVSVTDANGGTRRFEYTARYLSKAIDPEGTVYLQNLYDESGRVLEQIDAEGHHSFFQYEPETTVFTDNLGNVTYYEYDERYRVTSIRNALDFVERRIFNEHDLLIGFIDKNGNSWQHTYDERANRTETTNPLGNVIKWEYNEENDLVSEIDARGGANSYSWKAGKLTQIVRADGSTENLEYNGQGQLLSLTDAKGHSTKFTYDAHGNLAAVINPLGSIIQYEYDVMGRQTSMTDANAHVVHFDYDRNDNVIQIVYPKGSKVTFSYDGNGLLRSMNNREGGISSYTYDNNFNVLSKTGPAGNITRYEYDAQNRLIKRIDSRGHATVYRYDKDSRLAEVENAQGTVTRFERDANGNVLAAIDALGQIESFEYDALNRQVKKIDALGNVSTLAYDESGLPVALTLANGKTFHYQYDAVGRLDEIRDPVAGRWQLEYDAAGNRVALIDALGRKFTWEYDAANHLISARSPGGALNRLEYDAAGNPIASTDALGAVTRYTYDEHNNLIKTTNPLGHSSTMEYDAEDRLLAANDANGNTVRIEYDPNGLQTRVIDAEGYETYYEYDGVGNLIKKTNASGSAWTFSYDALNRPVIQTDPLGNITRLEYDPLGRLVRITDAMTGVTRYAYDKLDRVIQELDAEGGVWHFEYNEMGKLTASIDPRGAVSRMKYDALSRPIEVQNALGGISSFQYDALGNVTRVTDVNGNTVTLEYNEEKRLIQRIDALGNTARLAYDAAGNITSMTDALGRKTQYLYNSNRQLQSTIDALGGKTERAYDPAGNLVALTDANGHTSRFEYNGNNQLIALSTPGGETTRYEYDPAGNLSKETNAKGNSWLYTYDALDRLVRHTDPLDNSTIFEYDNLSRLTQIIDANGLARHYLYDKLGRLTAVRLPDESLTRYTYDAVDNLTSVVDANNNTTQFHYDLLGRPIQEVDPLGHTWQYEYDAAGNLIQSDVNGQITRYSYNANHLLTSITHPDGSASSYAYDAAGNQLSMSDRLGTAQHEYDELNRLVATTNQAGYRIGYDYDAVGNLIGMTYPDGSLMRREYDANNFVSRIIMPGLASIDITRDAAHNISRVSNSNGTTTEFERDSANRLTGVRTVSGSELLSSFRFTLDPVGNRVRAEEQYAWRVPRTLTYNYTYDKQYRLIRSEDNEGNFTAYSFDAVGNRLSCTTNIADKFSERLKTEYSYGAHNRLIAVRNFRDDGTGDWALHDETELAYDGYGRTIQRIYRQDGYESQQDFVYSGLDPVAEYAKDGSLHTNYYRGPNSQLLGMSNVHEDGSREHYFYHPDGLGSTSVLTNESGQIVHGYRYGDYGDVLNRNELQANSENFRHPSHRFAYTGQEWDLPNGLHHFYARDYDPQAGVWLQQDAYRGKLSDPRTLHRYAYVLGNPTSYTDLYGYGIFDKVLDLFKDAWDSLSGFVKKIGKTIERGVKSIGRAVGRVVSTIGKSIKKIGLSVVSSLAKLGGGFLASTVLTPLLLPFLGPFAPIVAGALGAGASAFLSSVAGGLILNGRVDWKNVLLSTATGAVSGGIGAGIGAGVDKIISMIPLSSEGFGFAGIPNMLLHNLAVSGVKAAGGALQGGVNQTLSDLILTGRLNLKNTLYQTITGATNGFFGSVLHKDALDLEKLPGCQGYVYLLKSLPAFRISTVRVVRDLVAGGLQSGINTTTHNLIYTGRFSWRNTLYSVVNGSGIVGKAVGLVGSNVSSSLQSTALRILPSPLSKLTVEGIQEAEKLAVKQGAAVSNKLLRNIILYGRCGL